MNNYEIEVVDRFKDDVPVEEMVYSPVPDGCTVFETRVYELRASGTRESIKNFVENVLVDEVSQEYSFSSSDDNSVAFNYDHYIDVWFKDSVLDLEEKYLFDYYRNHLDNNDFDVNSIRIVTRYYLRLSRDGENVIETLVGDLANPVIHDWSVEKHALSS